MEATRRLEIELPEEMANAVRAQVESGRFASESEAVAAALTLLREQDEEELEPWVRDEIAAAHAEWKANPTGGIPIEEVNAGLDEERARRADRR